MKQLMFFSVLIQMQLWSSDIALELGNERFSFFKMLNRFTLSEDSKELFECGGINLIKAIKRNIVTDRVQPMLRVEDDGKKGKKSEKEEEQKAIKIFFRGGSVPFEMVRISAVFSCHDFCD
jgi:hypothetical protein